jgi:hypothetical protein
LLQPRLRDDRRAPQGVGRREEAVAARQEAPDRYERKGVIPLVRRVRERLAALEPD